MTQYKKTPVFVRLVVALLVISLLVPIGTDVSAADYEQTRASYYLSLYGSYVHPAGNGLVQVWFYVDGTGYMDEIGALTIELYECPTNSSNIEDWEWKETFKYDTTPGMLSYNDDYHSGHVDYPDGKPGWWYKAYVCIWGGKDGDGDTRYFWTSAKQAT